MKQIIVLGVIFALLFLGGAVVDIAEGRTENRSDNQLLDSRQSESQRLENRSSDDLDSDERRPADRDAVIQREDVSPEMRERSQVVRTHQELSVRECESLLQSRELTDEQRRACNQVLMEQRNTALRLSLEECREGIARDSLSREEVVYCQRLDASEDMDADRCRRLLASNEFSREELARCQAALDIQPTGVDFDMCRRMLLAQTYAHPRYRECRMTYGSELAEEIVAAQQERMQRREAVASRVLPENTIALSRLNQTERTQLRAYVQEVGENISSPRDFGLHVAYLASENDRIREIHVDREEVRIQHQVRERFLGIIPFSRVVETRFDGERIEESARPWFSFLTRSESREAIHEQALRLGQTRRQLETVDCEFLEAQGERCEDLDQALTVLE